MVEGRKYANMGQSVSSSGRGLSSMTSLSLVIEGGDYDVTLLA